MMMKMVVPVAATTMPLALLISSILSISKNSPSQRESGPLMSRLSSPRSRSPSKPLERPIESQSSKRELPLSLSTSSRSSTKSKSSPERPSMLKLDTLTATTRSKPMLVLLSSSSLTDSRKRNSEYHKTTMHARTQRIS